MGKVINIRASQPDVTGSAYCYGCSHKWTAVVPHGMIMFDCPNCGLWKGVFAGLFIDVGQRHFICDCGCCHFFMQRDEEFFSCCLCGEKRQLD